MSEAENLRLLFYESEQVRRALWAQLEQEKVYRASAKLTIEAVLKRAERAEAEVARLKWVMGLLG
jgi:hypothetical protein